MVRICGEVRASPAEADEVMFLCTLCGKLKAEPYLINFFIEVAQLSHLSLLDVVQFFVMITNDNDELTMMMNCSLTFN